jgi:glycerate 2-kinase
MRLIAPTAFKGTMSPLQAAQHLAGPGDRLLPLSDGGDDFIECLQQELGGEINRAPAADPFGRIRLVPVLLLADRTAVLECAKVVGLAGLDRLDPLNASSRGLGDLLAHYRHASRIWLGLALLC